MLKLSGQSFSHPCLSASVSISPLFLITPPFPRTESSVRSPCRCWSFSARHRTNANNQIKEPRDECFKHSQYSHQRRGDILRGHILVSPLGYSYVFYDEGRILFTDVRVQHVLTNRSALPANVTGPSSSVSCPSACGQDS